MELSDRIAVMYRGKISAVVPNKGISKKYIGLLMAGVVPEEPCRSPKKLKSKQPFKRWSHE
jgi:ABC-type sugar transport system ATPase subunit